ncbi:RNA polymerase I-specific transcription initiation factor RRN3-domain-containing protein [Jimgerdemannia flammicorona]|uniref:RNA polymerase I-specific transcription initiation factor RRN3-domain-containing protein n=2 Tax=Jimgerdemannia flammicorona TaxID=994334 RepID=A0A433B9I1_9FUNG|nr:RNA polymerase I-specific transcription initiation factor RRN3-domain-containing protein [Jimgerdemannia flammicorona]RUS27042.1 RNA polymerase I-specific transcription initiation factor RRN3-domain-containing protein [Jimgerdemannia flammicorona]
MCSPNVVKQFARVSHTVDFLYIYPTLERNKRLFYPTASPLSRSITAPSSSTTVTSSDAAASSVPPPTQQDFESFFPFDPYRLKTSKRFVEDLYLEWQGDGEDESDEDGEDEGEEDEEEMNVGLMAMSISPSPTINRWGASC